MAIAFNLAIPWWQSTSMISDDAAICTMPVCHAHELVATEESSIRDPNRDHRDAEH
jgi:hypothetical protein